MHSLTTIKAHWRGKSTQQQTVWESGVAAIHVSLQRNLGNRNRVRNGFIPASCWEYPDIWVTGGAKWLASPLMLKTPFNTFHQKINFLAGEFLKETWGLSITSHSETHFHSLNDLCKTGHIRFRKSQMFSYPLNPTSFAIF